MIYIVVAVVRSIKKKRKSWLSASLSSKLILTDVKLLDCSNNHLTDIPASLSEMRAMEQLYLRHNKLRLLPKLPAPMLKVTIAT